MAKDVKLEGDFSAFDKQKKSVKAKPAKEVQHSFTIRHGVSTKVLLERLIKIKELTTPGIKSVSQGAMVREALDLLAEKMNYGKLEKKYSEFLEHINEDNMLNKG